MGVAHYYIIYRSHNVGQKHKEIQWRGADLQGFLYTALYIIIVSSDD